MKILGFDYRIIRANDSQYIGLHSADNLTISIDGNSPRERQIETMLHEFVEAVNTHTQLELEHNKITTLANVLYQILKDNGVNLNPLLRELK